MTAFGDLPNLVRTTTFRVVAYTAALILFLLIAVLTGVYVVTIGQAQREADAAAGREWRSLERVYAEGGIAELRTEVAERSARQTDMLYALVDVSGLPLYADFDPIPDMTGEETRTINEPFNRTLSNGRLVEGIGRGQIGRLLGGPVLVVMRDFGEANRVYRSLMDGLLIIGFLGFAGSIGAGLAASKMAAGRAQALVETAQQVKSGNLQKRVPSVRPRRKAMDEFDELDEEINNMLDELARLIEATRTAGDSIAHDLRSPMTRLKMDLEAMAAAPPGSDPERAYLAKAIGEVDKLLEMFNAIQRLMRLETVAVSSFDTIDITAMMRDLAEMYEPVAEDAGLKFAAYIADGLHYRGVKESFIQALTNLIENAIKYTPQGGKIEIRAGLRPDGQLEVAVLDDGRGIPEADRERVVQRFVRLEDDARATEGSGLGLSLVAAVARLHRGVLSLGEGLGVAARPGLRAALILPREQ